MQIIAFNGSPRKNGNTAQLLRETLNATVELGATTDFVHLADLEMKGCRGCYACKIEGKSRGRCVQQDDMTELYARIEAADAVLFGTPIYFGAMTPELKMLVDRFFPYLSMDFTSSLPKGKRAGVVVTQNQRDAALYEGHLHLIDRALRVIGFASVDFLVSVDTIGFEPMEKLAGKTIPKQTERKAKAKAELWPQDLAKARELGRSLRGVA